MTLITTYDLTMTVREVEKFWVCSRLADYVIDTGTSGLVFRDGHVTGFFQTLNGTSSSGRRHRMVNFIRSLVPNYQLF